MPELPSGTVTLLFTDVEGSTKLLHELGAEGYAQALAEHRQVIRDACASQGGVEVDTQGDAFFFAFPTAPGALAAAGAIVGRLEPGPIQVRMGLHTGTPFVTGDGYVGADVHRAARIAEAGHGGQVLVSTTTAALVDLDLRDLGEHRFKDLAAAERVYQLGDRDFPPLASLYRTNLPVPATPFLGRQQEVADVVGLLGREDVRLLTLTGPGGTGKTRLALQAAAETAESFPDGLWWVPLSALRDARLLVPLLARTLAIREEPGRELGPTTIRRLAGMRALVLLDNAEHLLPDVAGEIAALLDAVGPTLLATSRERLQLQGEQVYPVSTLDEADGVELFVARARALDPAFEGDGALREVCARLDQLPLALELAAARTVVFSPAQLLDRLSQRLDLLRAGRDADPRQHTLRATIEWSYDLLDAGEQALFRALSTFAGGCTYDAAEAVCGADPDTLQSLLDKSLLRRRNTALGPRYWMLETIRQFAAERLEVSGDATDAKRRHADHYLRLGESLGLTAENLERTGVQRHDVAIAEQSNFRSAIDWAAGADLELALRIAFSLENFWVTHDPLEGVRRFDLLLERGNTLPAELRAAALRCRGNATVMAGDRARGVGFYERSLASYRDAGNELGVALMEHRVRVNTLGDGDLERGRALLEASLARFRELRFWTGEVLVLGNLGWVEQRAGNTERAIELMEDGAEGARSLGFSWAEQYQREGLAETTLAAGQLDDAEQHASRALELARQTGDRPSTVSCLALLARVAAARGDGEGAGLLWGVVEGEEGRGPLGIWSEQRDRNAEAVLVLAGDDGFDQARVHGRVLSLADAVAYALGEPSDA